MRQASERPTRVRPSVIAALAFTFDLLRAVTAQGAGNPCEPEILKASQRYGIPTGILYAVGLTETGNKGSLKPYALNIEGKARFPTSREAAVAAFRQARSAGAILIDVGCMQINQKYHGSHFAGVEDMLDPGRNVDYAARFLRDLHAHHESWSMAVARYHAGPNNNPAQKVYICRVIANMVATGFGVWTANARSFCN